MRVRGGWLRIMPSVGSEFTRSYAELELDSCVQTEEWKRVRRDTSVTIPLFVWWFSLSASSASDIKGNYVTFVDICQSISHFI
jgi:hypothetical protein